MFVPVFFLRGKANTTARAPPLCTHPPSAPTHPKIPAPAPRHLALIICALFSTQITPPLPHAQNTQSELACGRTDTPLAPLKRTARTPVLSLRRRASSPPPPRHAGASLCLFLFEQKPSHHHPLGPSPPPPRDRLCLCTPWREARHQNPFYPTFFSTRSRGFPSLPSWCVPRQGGRKRWPHTCPLTPRHPNPHLLPIRCEF